MCEQDADTVAGVVDVDEAMRHPRDRNAQRVSQRLVTVRVDDEGDQSQYQHHHGQQLQFHANLDSADESWGDIGEDRAHDRADDSADVEDDDDDSANAHEEQSCGSLQIVTRDIEAVGDAGGVRGVREVAEENCSTLKRTMQGWRTADETTTRSMRTTLVLEDNVGQTVFV